MRACLSLTAHVLPQTQRAEHLLRDRGHRAPEVGPGPVSVGSVGHLLLLHLEGSQVHGESECRPPPLPHRHTHPVHIMLPGGCLAFTLYLFFFAPGDLVTKHGCREKSRPLARQVVWLI